MVIVNVITREVSFYLLGAISLWIALMVVTVYKLRPHRARDVRATFLKAAMLSTTTTTGFLLVASAFYLLSTDMFFQIGEIPDVLLAVAFFGSGILFIWTFGNYWAEVFGTSVTGTQNQARPQTSQESEAIADNTERENVVANLRRFNVRWEQYTSQPEHDRWHSPALEETKSQARVVSRILLDYVADESDTLLPHWRTEIPELANRLQGFGNYRIRTIGSSDWEEMDGIGKTAYDLSIQLVEDMSA